MDKDLFGLVLTSVSTLLMAFTFFMQMGQFRHTQKDSFRTRFEGTFFNMLSIFYNVRSETNKSIQQSSLLNSESLKDFYDSFKDEYKHEVETNKSFKEAVALLHKSDILPTQYETSLNDLGAFFDSYTKKQGCNAGFYFRYVHNLILFVIEHWKNSEKDIHTYLNFIQAQISDEELALLFYDSISKKGEDKSHRHTFKENLDAYSFLENITDNILLDRCHYKLFPHTVFRFLNEDERKEVRGKR